MACRCVRGLTRRRHGAPADGRQAINLRQIRYFCKVVEVGNITRASEQLFVAQPALGLQIRQLEQELGVPLLVRHSRGVLPTPPGKLLYEEGTEILGRVTDLAARVRDLGRDSGETLTLGLTPSVMSLIGTDLLLEVADSLPSVTLSLVEEMSFVLIEALDRGEMDVCLAYEYAERGTLSGTPLLDEELLFLTAPGAGAKEAQIPLEEALRSRLVLAGERDMVRRMVGERAAAYGIKVDVAFEAQSVALMKSMVALGRAATIMPYGIAADDMARGELVGRRMDPPLTRKLFLVWPAKRGPLRAQPEIDALLSRLVVRLGAALGPLVRPL